MIDAIDPERYEVVPIGITKGGKWLLGANPKALSDLQVSNDTPNSGEVLADIGGHGLVPIRKGISELGAGSLDVIFPLLHGPHGEDGTVQGLLELAGVPYIGAGVAASAVGMDKAMMKALFEHAGLPVPRYKIFTARDWDREPAALVDDIADGLGLPVFVKPCRMGSSIGISKASTTDELWASMQEALRYDRKVIVEEMIRGREIECGVLGNADPMVSVFGEVLSKHDFYDYESKYTEGLAELVIPAPLPPAQLHDLTDIATRAFKAIDAEGMARVDFFIEFGSERVILNEINTIPGFAPTSMFPKLWAASGLPYAELVDRLVHLALERAQESKP
jgi:D-alanine-D-alanine ligase